MSCGRKWLVDFNTGKTRLVSFNCSSNSGAINVKKDLTTLDKKNYLLGCLDCLSLLNSIGAITLSFLKLRPRKLMFLSSEVVLCFFKSIIWVFKKFYRHVWAGNRNLHLDMLNEIQKQVCGTLVLHLMIQLIPWVMVKMQPV